MHRHVFDRNAPSLHIPQPKIETNSYIQIVIRNNEGCFPWKIYSPVTDIERDST